MKYYFKSSLLLLFLSIFLGGCSFKSDEEKVKELQAEYTQIWSEASDIQKTKYINRKRVFSESKSNILIPMYEDCLDILMELKDDYSHTELMKKAPIKLFLYQVNSVIKSEKSELKQAIAEGKE